MTGASSDARSALPEVVLMIKVASTFAGRREYIVRRTSQTRVSDATGMASVLGSPSPGKEVMRRLTPCGWPAMGGVAMDAEGIATVEAMINYPVLRQGWCLSAVQCLWW